MKDHPTPQRSGRTAEEILKELQYGTLMADNTDPAMTNNLNEAQRQLFDATTALLPKPMEVEAYDHEPVKMYERGFNAAIEKMAKKLRVFFGQDGESNRKDGDE